MKTGLIIIHYNDYESLINLINNVKDYKVLDKILIYDNNSKQEIKKKLKKLNKDNIEVLIDDNNYGYSYAINNASKHLIKELGKCNIIISNSDVIINDEKDIKDLIKLLNKKEIGVVAPTIIENNKLNRGWKEINPILDSMLNIVGINKYLRRKHVYYKENYYSGDYTYVDIVSGCLFLIKSETLEKINFLDEKVFLYYEENILSKKIKNIGLKIIVSNENFIFHNHSVSIDKNVGKIKKLKLQKNSQYYFHKEYNKANIFEKALLKITAFLNRQILKLYYFIKKR